MKCVVLTACVMVAVASILNTAAADDKGDGEHAYDVISVEQTKKLKAIRDSYKRIAGLDKRYTDREHTNGLPYHIYVPKALEAGKEYPLVTFLHGYSDLTIDTHKGFPKGVWSLPLVQEKHPHILFVPRHRTLKDRWTNPKYRAMTIQALDDLVAELNGKEDTPNVDTNRIYLTGFSLGGIGTWNFIKNYPDKFAAACPLSGFSEGPQTKLKAEKLKHIPIWIFNGDGDRGVKGSRISFQALKEAGADDVRYHEYKKQGHVIDDFAYFTTGFMDWLFAQKLKPGADARKLSPGAVSKPERISLWNGKAPAGEGKTVKADAFVTVHRPANPNGASMVICPGGGYGGLVTGAEGHGIAEWLNRHGIAGIVLEYRLPRGNRFVPLLDAQRAIRLTRTKAVEWGCDPKRIGIIGFSAGGHLASTAATRFDRGLPDDPDLINRKSCRPDFAILVYPVITMGEKAHRGSRANLLGKAPDAATVDFYSNEKQVTSQTPPTFLAHARDDSVVSPDHSRMFYAAMQAHQVRGRYLELPSGNHGLNGYKGPMWDAWQTQSLQWLAHEKLIPRQE